MQPFDSKTMELMARALNRALHMLAKGNQQIPQDAKDMLSKHILHFAKRGEKNEVRLAFRAVAEFDRQNETQS
jgi:hypothetical protein